MLKMNFKRDFECGIWKAYVLQGLNKERGVETCVKKPCFME